jgi:hypothetical protein
VGPQFDNSAINMSDTNEDNRKRKSRKVDLTLSQKYRDLCTQSILLISGKAELLVKLRQDLTLFCQLLEAVYVPDVNAPGARVMPYDEDMAIDRERNGVIVKLRFPKSKERFFGANLSRVAGAFTYSQQGYDVLVWSENESSCKTALLLPKCNTEEGIRDHPKEDGKELSLVRVFTKSSGHKLYVTIESFLTVVSVDSIKLHHFKDILVAMNAVAKQDPDATFTVPTLTSIVKASHDTESVNRAWSMYYHTVLGAFMENATLDERLKAFLDHGPSLTLALSLKIPKVQSQKLFDEDSKALPRTKLNAVADDTEVLLSDLTLPSNAYKGLAEHTLDVYAKPDYAYGKKVNNTIKVMDCETIKASKLKQLVNAVFEARVRTEAGRSLTVAADPNVADDDEGYVDAVL